jgi:hypothetical protein
MIYSTSVEFEVEAETYDEAVKKAYEQAADFPPDVKELECELEDYYEESSSDYEYADGYYDDPDEDEEFEPGRPILDQMALNP